MDKTSIGDRMKEYEKLTESKLLPRVPIIARLDGRSFSKFTADLEKPFDHNFMEAMVETTKYLVAETQAKIGYTQSDEISLVLYADDHINGNMMFSGRVQKMASVFAGLATAKFIMEMQKRFPNKLKSKLPSFDCRVFSVPSKIEAVNAIRWRVQDATKNSISMLAHHHFAHSSLHKLNSKQKQHKLITQVGVNWNDLSSAEKEGTFVQRIKVWKKMDEELMARIPVASRPEDGMVQRSSIEVLDMPFFKNVVNPVEVFFDKQPPLYATEESGSC